MIRVVQNNRYNSFCIWVTDAADQEGVAIQGNLETLPKTLVIEDFNRDESPEDTDWINESTDTVLLYSCQTTKEYENYIKNHPELLI